MEHVDQLHVSTCLDLVCFGPGMYMCVCAPITSLKPDISYHDLDLPGPTDHICGSIHDGSSVSDYVFWMFLNIDMTLALRRYIEDMRHLGTPFLQGSSWARSLPYWPKTLGTSIWHFRSVAPLPLALPTEPHAESHAILDCPRVRLVS